ncbi:hypothetical protein A0H81_13177 [Grifola frondosa]|uniref:Uncharacterized protein n=1 Tax=Grifola frondosa TaxID=5627 RepID=A0A1C7LPU4_GRIFR|nr:hypothetical protein A0H81_13177 [Grifola frondosa]
MFQANDNAEGLKRSEMDHCHFLSILFAIFGDDAHWSIEAAASRRQYVLSWLVIPELQKVAQTRADDKQMNSEACMLKIGSE